MLALLFAASVMTVHAHMSMQFPLARNRDAGGNNYEVWKLNEPMIPARPSVCHGLPRADVPAGNVFNAGDIITLDIEGTASHYGGHCAFWYSTDDVTFTKIVDIKDCTLAPDTTRVQLPDNMAAECETRCTFAWTWTPRVSGLCEVYSNCADIRVNGLSGESYTDPDAMDFVNLVANRDTLCQRVNEQTHWSGLFMPLKEQEGTFPPIEPSSPTTPAPSPPTTPAPTITPSPVSGGNIKIAHSGSVNQWWYAATLIDVNPSATDVEMSVTTQTNNGPVAVWCTIDVSSGSTVYNCEPPTEGYRLPLDVRLWENHLGGEEISAKGLITAFEGTYDMGTNFGGGPGPSPVTPVTPSPVTPAPVTPAPITPEQSITMTTITRPAGNRFWYSAEVHNLADPVFIDMLEVRSKNGEYNFCHGVSLSKCTVFECQPPGTEGYEYPLSVRMLGSNGQIIEALDAIETDVEDAVWTLGIQFSVNGFDTPSPAMPPNSVNTPSPTPAPVTFSPIATPSPNVSPITPSPTDPPVTPSPTNPSSPTPPPTRADNPAVHEKEIIGYYPTWQWYDRNKLAAPTSIDFSKYTIINFAFFHPDTEGYLYGTDEWSDFNVLWGGEISWPVDETLDNWKCIHSDKAPQEMKCRNSKVEEGLIHLAHSAGAKVFPSLGGWTLSDNFPGIAADPVKRKRLADQCVDLLRIYGFDGIDVDWEYPGYADHSGTAADTENYNLLLADIRDALDAYAHEEGLSKYYELTAALPCGVPQINDIDGETVSHLLDQFNLMTYDLFGAFSERTGANAGLYFQGWPDDLPDNNVDGCVKNWRAMGVPDHKINIGLPFYGRSYAQAKGFNEEFNGKADLTHWGVDEGVPQFFNIEVEIENGNLNTIRHEPSYTEGGFFEEGGFVSFDDQQAICDKVEYTLNEGLNGFIVWEITGDVRADLSTPLIDEVLMKLEFPDTHNCAAVARERARENAQNQGKKDGKGKGDGDYMRNDESDRDGDYEAAAADSLPCSMDYAPVCCAKKFAPAVSVTLDSLCVAQISDGFEVEDCVDGPCAVEGVQKGTMAVKAAAKVRTVQSDLSPEMADAATQIEGVSTMAMVMEHLTTILLLVILSTMCAFGCLAFVKANAQSAGKNKYLEEESDM